MPYSPSWLSVLSIVLSNLLNVNSLHMVSPVQVRLWLLYACT